MLHALSGPLQTIDGFSLILQEDYTDRALDLEGWQHLQRIRNDAARMRSMLDDLSAYLGVLTADLQIEPVDITQIAWELARRFHSEEPDRNVEWRIAPRLIVAADSALMHLALDQLLQNSWKFTRKTPSAVIEVTRGNGAELLVRDNGAGFDNRYTDELFTPFRRLHHPNEFAGSGMGLAIVQEVMRRLGGVATAAGEPQKGATITLHFPTTSA